MRLAYVIINANRHEGTSRAVVEVAERLAESHEVHLWARRAESFDDSRIRWRRVAGPGWPSVVELDTFARAADRGLQREDYDIIHCAGVNTTQADVYTVQTVQVEKRRVMQEIGGHEDAGWHRRLTRALYDRRVIAGERACYHPVGPRGVRAFAPVAQGVATELERHYAVARAEVDIIPNGADLDRFNPALRLDARRVLSDRHRLDEGDFLLLFTGGEWRRKGLDLAIRAMAVIDQPRAKLVVVGTDPVGAELESLPGRLGVADRVVFAGYRKDIESYNAACDLMVFPSAYEAFSLATIEAAASGLPVLMGDVSGAAELVGSGEAGRLVDRDPHAIASAVGHLMNNPSELSRLRQTSRALCEREYSWDRVAERTANLYERLLDRRAREESRSRSSTRSGGPVERGRR